MAKVEGGELDGDRRYPVGVREGSYDGEIERHHWLCGNGVFELNFPSQLLLWNQGCNPTGIKRKSSEDSMKTFWWTCSWNGGQLPRPCRTAVPLSGSRLLCCDFSTPHSQLSPRLSARPCSLWDGMFVPVTGEIIAQSVLKRWEFSGWMYCHICIQVWHYTLQVSFSVPV